MMSIPEKNVAETAAERPPKKRPPQKRSGKPGFAAILLFLLLLIVALICFYVIKIANDLAEDNSELRAAYTELQTKEMKYDADCEQFLSFFENGNAGYGDAFFYAEEPVVVLNLTDEGKSFRIHAAYDDQYSVVVNTKGSSASVAFPEDRSIYDQQSDINITPKSEGMTVVTFSNTLNDTTFSVLIVVRGDGEVLNDQGGSGLEI